MRTAASLIVVLALVSSPLLPHDAAAAQETNPVHAHIGHVADEWQDTPDGQGLLPTAIAEAEAAAQHAALAAGDPSDLEAMKQHAQHVLHAIDPSEVESGPGLGYGLKTAAEGASQHIELAAQSEDASEDVTSHAAHIAASIENTITRADRMVELVQEIDSASSATDAAPLVEELSAVAEQLIAGEDADGDGEISWEEGEGGLEQAEQHVDLLKQAEGIS